MARHTAMMTRFGILVIALLARAAHSHVLSATEESEVRVISNPHEVCDGSKEGAACSSLFGAAASCDPALLLSPHRILRTPMATQTDTLVKISYKKVLSVPVPVYHFRQPARLSPRALPFRLVLVSDIDSAAARDALRAVPVDPAAAADSWFPGYAWAPVVYAGCDGPVHVGWKFSNQGGFFYALIVDAKDDAKDSVLSGVGALGEAIAESFTIGMRAPAWMIEVLTNM